MYRLISGRGCSGDGVLKRELMEVNLCSPPHKDINNQI